MSDFNEGDLVEAVKGEFVTVARITTLPSTGELCLPRNPEQTPEQWTFIAWLRRPENGYTLRVIEKAAPPLPTTPGYYHASGPYASVGGTLQLDNSDQWWWVGNEYKPNPEKIPTDRVSEFAPLTRLEPVSSTDARILPSLKEAARCIARPEGSGRSEVSTTDVLKARRILANLITELGVTL